MNVQRLKELIRQYSKSFLSKQSLKEQLTPTQKQMKTMYINTVKRSIIGSNGRHAPKENKLSIRKGFLNILCEFGTFSLKGKRKEALSTWVAEN